MRKVVKKSQAHPSLGTTGDKEFKAHYGKGCGEYLSQWLPPKHPFFHQIVGPGED